MPSLRASRLGRPAHARQASERCDLWAHSVAFVSEVFAQRRVRPARNADGGAAMTHWFSLIALAIIAQVVTSCADQERFRGRSSDQVKQACDPQRQTPDECSRTLDK
jgi:hypothetical protein